MYKTMRPSADSQMCLCKRYIYIIYIIQVQYTYTSLFIMEETEKAVCTVMRIKSDDLGMCAFFSDYTSCLS